MKATQQKMDFFPELDTNNAKKSDPYKKHFFISFSISEGRDG